WAGDVVARGYDHVVRPRLLVEVAVAVAEVAAAGRVPSVLAVGRLAVTAQVTAAGRPLHRQPAQLAIGDRSAVRVLDLGKVARHRAAGAAGADFLSGGGDE